MEGNGDMGDLYLTYDDGGAYQRRWVYLNILCLVLFVVVGGYYYVVNNWGFIVIIIPAALVAGSSLIYALYFIRKNPP